MNIQSFARRVMASTALVLPALCMALSGNLSPTNAALSSPIPAHAQHAAAAPLSCNAQPALNPFGIFGAESGGVQSARDANYYNCRCCTAFGWPDCCAKCH